MQDFAQRTEWMRSFIEAEHFRYRHFATDGPRADELAITRQFQLCIEAPRTKLTDRMTEDFREYCRRCLDLPLNETVFGSSPNAHTIRWRIADRANPEAFAIAVSASEIHIEAGHECGLLHGTHYLERLMAQRGAPFLPLGRIERAPRFSPRISNSIFINSNQHVTDPGQFSDAYLSLMSHFGVNGIHLHTHLWDFSRNTRLPELNCPDFDRNLRALNELIGRAAVYGIDVYLYLAPCIFAPDHPVFQAHPEARGAKMEFVIEGQFHHNLCSGNERVLACYEEVLEGLFRAAPGVAGAIILVGGEGFFHCYTRPWPPFEGTTNCPLCQSLDPSRQVAQLVNRCAAAVKRTGTHKLVFAWPYSAFTWSGNDRAQLRWIEQLSDDVNVLATFDTGSPDTTTGGGAFLFDYNIKSIGPSEVFAAQARKCRELGRPVFTKMETNTTPDAFFVPYIPVHHRWHGRFRSMAETGVAGFIGQWRFYGMNGSPPEELQYHATWNPDRDADSLLHDIARRDFQLSDDPARAVVDAWRKLSEAWDDLPYSAHLCGERHYYMRGPFYLGPAHPLIFNPQDAYPKLGPKFRLLREDLFELGEPENLAEMIRNAPPRYVSDLLITSPFGVERFLELIGRCRARWSVGVDELKAALGPDPTERARMELNVCETILIHLATTENVVRFLDARDRLLRERTDLVPFRASIEGLASLARAEVENARRILPIMDSDPRISYGHCYRIVYDREMVEQKIAHCESFLQSELPRFSTLTRFHLWNDYP